MQYSAIVAAFLAVGSTSARSISRQDTDLGLWTVTNFLASGAPYSITTTYSFDITDNTTATHCSASVSTEPEIGYAPYTLCENPIYSFAFNSEPEVPAPPVPGYYLQIWEEDPNNEVCGAAGTECVLTARQIFPATDVVTVVDPSGSGDPNGDFEVLETAADFTIVISGSHI